MGDIPMRFDLRLHGRTKDGKKCQADISVFANSKGQMERETIAASENAAWHSLPPNEDWVPEGSTIIVEHVELLKSIGRMK
jgi:hypothetical protein